MRATEQAITLAYRLCRRNFGHAVCVAAAGGDAMIDDLDRPDEEMQASTAAIRKAVAAMEHAQATQPQRPAEASARANAAREECLASESWDDAWTVVPTTDLDGGINGVLCMPSIDAKEIWGTRLAFDLLRSAGRDDQADETLNDYFVMVGEPGHMFLVCAAALKVIAKFVVPEMLDEIEQRGGNWDDRVLLAEAAENAWRTEP
jgi:hypothetical protein